MSNQYSGQGSQSQGGGTMMSSPPYTDAMNYSSWGKRVGATIIDAIIIGIVGGIIGAILGAVGGDSGSIIGSLAGIVVYLAYETIMVGQGQTIGNKVLGMRIVTGDGAAPGYGKAFVRTLISLAFDVISIVALVDVLMPLWDKQKQTLHDKIAGTFAVNV